MSTRGVNRQTKEKELNKITKEIDKLTKLLRQASIRQTELVESLSDEQQLTAGDYVRYRSTGRQDGFGYVHHTTQSRVHITETRNGRNYFPRSYKNVFLVEKKDAGTADIGVQFR